MNCLPTPQLLATRLDLARSLQGSCQLFLFFLGRFVVALVLLSPAMSNLMVLRSWNSMMECNIVAAYSSSSSCGSGSSAEAPSMQSCLFSSGLFLAVATGDDVLLVRSPPSYG